MNRILTAALFVYTAAAVVTVSAWQAPAGLKSVWDGVFTDAQAERGRTLYAEHCASCHGGELRGGEGKAITGDRFWADWKETTVDYLLGQISTNMPFSEDGSLAGTLPASTYQDIVAHILRSNGFPAGAAELTGETSKGVAIIRKEGPGELPASTLAHVVGCLARGADGKSWRLVQGSKPVRVLSSKVPPNRAAPLGDREYALKFVMTPLDKYAGYRMSVTGLLLGEGGAEGVNVTTVTPVTATCS